MIPPSAAIDNTTSAPGQSSFRILTNADLSAQGVTAEASSMPSSVSQTNLPNEGHVLAEIDSSSTVVPTDQESQKYSVGSQDNIKRMLTAMMTMLKCPPPNEGFENKLSLREKELWIHSIIAGSHSAANPPEELRARHGWTTLSMPGTQELSRSFPSSDKEGTRDQVAKPISRPQQPPVEADESVLDRVGRKRSRSRLPDDCMSDLDDEDDTQRRLDSMRKKLRRTEKMLVIKQRQAKARASFKRESERNARELQFYRDQECFESNDASDTSHYL
eukprot:TRINITY_DN914_c0_g1_i15.p1 TRINITY_DN914_c0_g1~~TRINITY_DN914_c0_g1_i15.p1  ORF type:complete len:275 (+),score=7.16 TRINITY_DN914_c0_g1_i15:227-1051(+)